MNDEKWVDESKENINNSYTFKGSKLLWPIIDFKRANRCFSTLKQELINNKKLDPSDWAWQKGILKSLLSTIQQQKRNQVGPFLLPLKSQKYQ